MLIELLWSEFDAARLAAFGNAVRDKQLASALLAIEGADSETQERCHADLDDWARLLRLRVEPENPTRCAEALRRLLVRQLSFRGAVDDYYSPDNASLSRVIERRRGMPILLSTIWIEVGRRAGIEMHGIGMPGHFVARVGGFDGPLVDPFSGGCRLSVKQCAQLVGRLSNSALPWSEQYLEPVQCDSIVERVLRNLLNAYRRRGDTIALFKVSRFHAELRADDPEPALLHACLAEEIGACRHAATLYERICEDFPDSKEARAASRRRDRAVRIAANEH